VHDRGQFGENSPRDVLHGQRCDNPAARSADPRQEGMLKRP
jgi:hypothetical protein